MNNIYWLETFSVEVVWKCVVVHPGHSCQAASPFWPQLVAFWSFLKHISVSLLVSVFARVVISVLHVPAASNWSPFLPAYTVCSGCSTSRCSADVSLDFWFVYNKRASLFIGIHLTSPAGFRPLRGRTAWRFRLSQLMFPWASNADM